MTGPSSPTWKVRSKRSAESGAGRVGKGAGGRTSECTSPETAAECVAVRCRLAACDETNGERLCRPYRWGTTAAGHHRARATRGATDSSSRRIRNGEFIHVCASQNALFALDQEGDSYQYHFNAKKTSVTLVATGESEETRT